MADSPNFCDKCGSKLPDDAGEVKEASVQPEPSIAAIARGVRVELDEGAPNRELATWFAMDNLSRDPSHYK